MKLSEAHIQKACEDFLCLDGWRIHRLEQNYSERKRKVIGEAGAPDALAVRYHAHDGNAVRFRAVTEVMFLEFKRPGGRPSQKQLDWHRLERARGALTLIAGQDFPATVDGFIEFYRSSGLLRRKGL